ncbi:hypothetical protein DXT99_23920 [Pontibacter diazotrophicus]|uniref:Uncharacterized protein n=1 Tax=Pontibacter diazotrophicus TaxID=1400979 RepID=A0A3D8L397_9BACT|nr:hypothetical protein DXT99_23920 [Pontibacter diazotrophicus]
MNNGTLTISEYQGIPIPGHDKVLAVDDIIDWQLLLEFLKACNWKRRYDSNILDGTQWELTVSGKGISVRSYGSNAYPENFDMFLMLLNKVTGVVGVRISI